MNKITEGNNLSPKQFVKIEKFNQITKHWDVIYFSPDIEKKIIIEVVQDDLLRMTKKKLDSNIVYITYYFMNDGIVKTAHYEQPMFIYQEIFPKLNSHYNPN
jgi:hypothetical protein